MNEYDRIHMIMMEENTQNFDPLINQTNFCLQVASSI